MNPLAGRTSTLEMLRAYLGGLRHREIDAATWATLEERARAFGRDTVADPEETRTLARLQITFALHDVRYLRQGTAFYRTLEWIARDGQGRPSEPRG